MARIRTWTQKNGIEIDEVRVDPDTHAFTIYVDGRYITTIYADSPEPTDSMRVALDAGEDVQDWRDWYGNTVRTLIAERTGDGLRETLRRLEEEGMRYTTFQLSNDGDGIVWIDNDIYYEYETDNLDLRVDDLTNEDLKNVVIKEGE